MKLVVDKESLVSVADAIREKGGTAESLTFPQGFVEAVNAIESGGGGNPENAVVIFSEWDNNGLPTKIKIPNALVDIPNDYLNASGTSGHEKVTYFLKNVSQIENNPNCQRIGSYAFAGLNITSINLPDTITEIGKNAFSNCVKLSISKLPNSLSAVSDYCFFNNTLLQSPFIIPQNVVSVNAQAFAYCRFAEVRFMGSTSTINSTAFSKCNYLKDIYVPWSEGAVANAPWGATNATIHYNSEV